MCKNHTQDTESDNASSVFLKKSHNPLSWGLQAKAFTKGLRRRDLTKAIIARFHTKYKTADGCWEWQAGKFPRGYGMVNLGRNIRGQQFTTYAHRVAYVLHRGPIPAGLVVMHQCDNPSCVNPDHLSLGTQAANVADASMKGHYAAAGLRRRKLTPEQRAIVIATAGQRGLSLHKKFGVSAVQIARIRRAALGAGYSVFVPRKYRKVA